MIYELSQRFYFEAAHTLEREIDANASRRIHGHTYQAEVTLRGQPDSRSGMVMDLGHFRQRLDEVKALLDHRLLDEVEGLGLPTLEGLCAFIADRLIDRVPGLVAVTLWRTASGDTCRLLLENQATR